MQASDIQVGSNYLVQIRNSETIFSVNVLEELKHFDLHVFKVEALEEVWCEDEIVGSDQPLIKLGTVLVISADEFLSELE